MNKKYNLVLEALPGDFMPIDINLLMNSRSKINYSSLETIDMWTKNYSYDEIICMIKDTNITQEKYFNGTLHIINEKKYRYEVITKDHQFALDKYIYDNIDNKLLMNKLVNIYQKYEKNNIENFKDAINKKHFVLVISLLNSLSYSKLRKIYFYFYNNR